MRRVAKLNLIGKLLTVENSLANLTTRVEGVNAEEVRLERARRLQQVTRRLLFFQLRSQSNDYINLAAYRLALIPSFPIASAWA